jgi:hypothetical protein
MNITGLLLDILAYHYFPYNAAFKFTAKNLDNVSIFMICIIVISQAMFIFMQNHQKFIMQHKFLAVTVEACISTVFLWFLTIDNEIQGEVVIFSSSITRTDHSRRLLFVLVAIFIMLVFDFYRNFKNQSVINDTSIRNIIRSVFKIVIRKHLLIFIFIFGIVHIKKIRKFAIALLHQSESSLFYDFNLLEFLIPIIWIATIIYYIYSHFYLKTNNNETP